MEGCQVGYLAKKIFSNILLKLLKTKSEMQQVSNKVANIHYKKIQYIQELHLLNLRHILLAMVVPAYDGEAGGPLV